MLKFLLAWCLSMFYIQFLIDAQPISVRVISDLFSKAQVKGTGASILLPPHWLIRLHNNSEHLQNLDESFTRLLSDSCQLSWTIILVWPHVWEVEQNSHPNLIQLSVMLVWPGHIIWVHNMTFMALKIITNLTCCFKESLALCKAKHTLNFCRGLVCTWTTSRCSNRYSIA